MRVDILQTGIADLTKDPRLADQMLEVAKACRNTAIVKAHKHFGTYKRSMFAAKLSRGGGALYGSSDPKANLMEYGSKHNKAFHTLRNAARSHRLPIVEG